MKQLQAAKVPETVDYFRRESDVGKISTDPRGLPELLMKFHSLEPLLAERSLWQAARKQNSRLQDSK
ncbi:MAG TPA: hypothetical protein VE954_23495 [Oligoflexus sp.]|uniref:hypothetical protein n=1 Tax=Oligoflexus sp. TaxID=1971216 RepID=UPI002D6DF211|nr:hypothetical protein [Oligoflexus sp.]HYX36078.1 hypothetical protein [Oligoflexus sp.]